MKYRTISLQITGEERSGQVDFSELKEFSLINKTLAEKHGLTPWANIETFERGMPMDILPIDWRNLNLKWT